MSDYWRGIAPIANRSPAEAFRQIDHQMNRVLEAIKIRRVQRVPYHFHVRSAGQAIVTTPMYIPGLSIERDEMGAITYSGDTAYLIARGGYIIDITIMSNVNITTSGFYVYIKLNGELKSGQAFELSTSRKERVGSTNFYRSHYPLDYGDRSSYFRIDPLSTLEVSYRAISSGVVPADARLLVSVNIAHTGED